MKDTLTVFKWFWADQDQEQETWLEEMARRGLHVQDVGMLFRYTFASGPASDVVYRMDSADRAKQADYLQLMNDAGWQMVTRSDAWSYWRHSAAEARSVEIFSDVESKVAQYKRVMVLHLGSLLAPLGAVPMLANSTTIPMLWKTLFAAFVVPAVALALYRMLRLKRRIGQLRGS